MIHNLRPCRCAFNINNVIIKSCLRTVFSHFFQSWNIPMVYFCWFTIASHLKRQSSSRWWGRIRHGVVVHVWWKFDDEHSGISCRVSSSLFRQSFSGVSCWDSQLLQAQRCEEVVCCWILNGVVGEAVETGGGDCLAHSYCYEDSGSSETIEILWWYFGGNVGKFRVPYVCIIKLCCWGSRHRRKLENSILRFCFQTDLLPNDF